MKKAIAGLVGSCFVLLASPASAGASSWDYVSLSWNLGGELEHDPVTYDMSGFQFAAVKRLGDVVFLNARADMNSVDMGSNHVDYSAQQIGVGGRFAVSTSVDLWASLNYERYDLAPFLGTGTGADVGLRWRATDAFGLDLAAKVAGNIDFEVADGDYTGFDVVGLYALNPHTALTLSYAEHTLDINGQELKFSGVTRLGVRLGF